MFLRFLFVRYQVDVVQWVFGGVFMEWQSSRFFILRALLFHSISEIKAQSSVLRINPTKCDLKTEVVEL